MSTKRVIIIEHVVHILECFNIQKPSLTLSELQTLVDIPKSTLHRILLSLLDQGVLLYDNKTHQYTYGTTILRWSAAMFHNLKIHDVARSYLTSLRDRSGETATLTIRTGLQRMYIDQIQSQNEVRMSIDVGKILPLYPGANGKVILSSLSNEKADEVISKYFSNTQQINISKESLLLDLQLVRERGFAISVGERVHESVSVSAPLFSSTEEVMGSIGLSGPAGRFTVKEAHDWGPILRDTASEISARTIWMHQW